MRMAARAESAAEKSVYLSIADGWRKLAAEVQRNEPREGDSPQEARSFKPLKEL
ncbi:hypothetical protein LJR225_004550 [Phenylobacterium sp. LjRoot225]|uniref:hypothetical protein n=1 Tax=Phenylobacterium sp. LjRoot225 TaxID=3342285 RepID=UPI003ED05109